MQLNKYYSWRQVRLSGTFRRGYDKPGSLMCNFGVGIPADGDTGDLFLSRATAPPDKVKTELSRAGKSLISQVERGKLLLDK